MSIVLIKPKEKKPPKRKSKPYYILTIYYMIGDADGDTSEEVEISADNPFLERFCKILKKLRNPEGHWGISLNDESLEANYLQKHITKDDYNFFRCMMSFDPEDEDLKGYLKTEKEEEFAAQFNDVITSEIEYSFLTYQGFTLVYVDEYKVKHKTRIK